MFATKSPCPDNHHQVSTMKEEILATMKYVTFWSGPLRINDCHKKRWSLWLKFIIFYIYIWANFTFATNKYSTETIQSSIYTKIFFFIFNHSVYLTLVEANCPSLRDGAVNLGICMCDQTAGSLYGQTQCFRRYRVFFLPSVPLFSDIESWKSDFQWKKQIVETNASNCSSNAKQSCL